MRTVSVTPTIMPGVVITTEGTWPAFDENGIDISGNPNTLGRDMLCGEGQQPWNTTLVKIEKWTGAPLVPDYKWPLRMPKMA